MGKINTEKVPTFGTENGVFSGCKWGIKAVKSLKTGSLVGSTGVTGIY